MQEWQRIKEDKLRAEQEAEAAQRAAEEEAGKLNLIHNTTIILTTHPNWFTV